VRTAQGVEVDPKCAAVVRRLFAMAKHGESLRAIAAKLEAEGISAPHGGSLEITLHQ
jgi:hypothetical protein